MLEGAGLIKKTGAQFHIGNGSKSLYLVFRNGRFTREPEAFQVERSSNARARCCKPSPPSDISRGGTTFLLISPRSQR